MLKRPHPNAARTRRCAPPPCLAALVAAVACVSLLAACTPGERAPAPTAPAGSAGTILFDMAHGEVFGPDDTSELGHSRAVARMRGAGFDVRVGTSTIAPAALAQASGLVIAGPMRPLLDEEYAAITSFIERGGTVLLTIHVPMPVMKVPAHWGLPVGDQVVCSPRSASAEGEPSVFVADRIVESPVTEGVSRVLVVSGWPVGAVGNGARLVVSTADDCWTAPTGDRAGPAPAPGAPRGSFGIIGVTRIGKGLLIVAGDDAIFANVAIGHEDNARLLDNILRLMRGADET